MAVQRGLWALAEVMAGPAPAVLSWGRCQWRWVSVVPRASVTEEAKVWIFGQTSHMRNVGTWFRKISSSESSCGPCWPRPCQAVTLLVSACRAHGLHAEEQVARGGTLTGVRELRFRSAASTRGLRYTIMPPAASSMCHPRSGCPGTLSGHCWWCRQRPYVILLDSWLLKCVCVIWSCNVTVSRVVFLNE